LPRSGSSSITPCSAALASVARLTSGGAACYKALARTFEHKEFFISEIDMNLTIPHNLGYSFPALAKSGVWIGILNTKGANRLINAVFLCAKSQFIIMLDWVRLSSEGLVSFVPVCQPCSVRHHDWHRVVGFNNLTKGDYHV